MTRNTPDTVSALLIQCTRPRPDPNELRRLVSNCEDWDALAAVAWRQGLTPLVFWSLNRICADLTPPKTLKKFRALFQATTKNNLIFTSELIRILDQFEGNGIQAIPFKGAVLAWSLYETPGLRTTSDLDVLVTRRDIKPALALLAASGYKDLTGGADLKFLADARQISTVSSDGNIRVDLHWELASARTVTLDVDAFRKRATSIDIAGRKTLTLCPEDLLVFLCLHGAKHAWSSLLWISDLARLIDAYPLDWDAVLSHTGERRLARAISLGLHLSCDLMGSELPPEVSKRVEPDAKTRSLAALVRTWISEPQGHSLMDEHHFQYRLADRFVDKAFFLWYRLQPTDADWNAIPLPRWLFPAYFLLRPIRLVWKRRFRRTDPPR